MTVVEVAAAVVAGVLGLAVVFGGGLLILTAVVFADETAAWVAKRTPEILLDIASYLVLTLLALLFLLVSYGVGAAIIRWVSGALP